MQHATAPSDGEGAGARSARERIGFVVTPRDARAAASAIVAAEAAGVRQVWMTQSTPAPDMLTIFAAAAAQTSAIRMGTAIVPTYPRHPLALVQQALALDDLAPGRLRLGVGPSHRPIIEGVYGLPLSDPLAHLREYVAVVRGALWDGVVEHTGRFYSVHTRLPRTPRTPVLISALRTGAFHLAGEVADGAISWVCPVPYLLEQALPALQAGAAAAGRAAPPMVAHIPVALSQDRAAVTAAARVQLGRYGRLPFYARMFADAGYPVTDGTMSDDLFAALVVSGNEESVARRLQDLLATGLDELLVMPIAVGDAADEHTRLARLIGQL